MKCPKPLTGPWKRGERFSVTKVTGPTSDQGRIYGLPDHEECPCGCGDYVSEPLRWPPVTTVESVNVQIGGETKEPVAQAWA